MRGLRDTALSYPLTAPDGAVLEVIPRTRLLPVLAPSRWGDWHGLLAEALPNRTSVERAVREQHVVLAFELWGYCNPHLIRYDTPLALTLHTAIRHRKPASYRRLADIAQRCGLHLSAGHLVLRLQGCPQRRLRPTSGNKCKPIETGVPHE